MDYTRKKGKIHISRSITRLNLKILTFSLLDQLMSLNEVVTDAHKNIGPKNHRHHISPQIHGV